MDILSKLGEIFRAYTVSAFLLYGVLIAFMVLAAPRDALSSGTVMVSGADFPFWVFALGFFVFLFFTSPFLVFVLPHSSGYSHSIVVAVPTIYYFSWALAWYVMYGRKCRPVSPAS